MIDFIGQELNEGDYVAGLYSDDQTPHLFQVVGFTPKKVRIATLNPADSYSTKFPKDLVVVDAETVKKLLALPPTDRLGQELAIGDYVYGSDGSYIEPVIFEIEGFVAQRASIKKLVGRGWVHESTRFTSDLIKVDPRLVTMHMLTKDHKK